MSTIEPILKKILLFLINLLDNDPNMYFLLTFWMPVGVITLIIATWIIIKIKEKRSVAKRKE